MRRDDTTTLTDIANACRLVIDFTKGFDSDSFLADQKTQSAVMHQIMIIGEAAKRVSPEFRSEHSQIPWKQIAGMRDFLIHAYDYVDIERVWGTTTINVPELLRDIEPLLPAESAE